MWDSIGIHLPAEAFTQLALRIQAVYLDLCEYTGNGRQGHCRLQVGQLSVEIPMADFMPLAEKEFVSSENKK